MILGNRALPLAVMAAVGPIVAVPIPQSLVVVVAVAGLWAALQSFILRQPIADRGVLTAAAVLTFAAALTALWSDEPRTAVLTSLRVGAMAFPGACLLAAATRLDESGQRLLGLGLAVGLIGSAGLLLHEYADSGGVAQLLEKDLARDGKSVANRSTSLAAMLLAPAVLVLARRISVVVAVGVAAALVAAILVSDNGTSKIAVLAGAVVAACGWLHRTVLVVGLRAAIVAMLVLIPLLTAAIPDPQTSYQTWGWQHYSLHHRLTIWRFVGDRIADRPMLGWGMDSSRTIPGGDGGVVVERPDQDDRRSEQMLPLHPHNAVLQVWLELGAGGALALGALLWVLVGKVVASGDRWARAAAAMTLVAALVIACSSYGLWQGWWQAALWIAAVTVAGCVKAGSDNDQGALPPERSNRMLYRA